jgi:hypothetical protein
LSALGYNRVNNMKERKIEPTFHAVHKGLFLAVSLPELKKAAEASPNVRIHVLQESGETYMTDEANPETGEVTRVMREVPRGAALVSVMRNDGRKDLSVFWGRLDQIMRHPSRRSEPIRKNRPRALIRSYSRVVKVKGS